MAELLPELWATRLKKAVVWHPIQVTDLLTWLQCLSLYSGVLGRHDPIAMPELMIYSIKIARASQDFAGIVSLYVECYDYMEQEVVGE